MDAKKDMVVEFVGKHYILICAFYFALTVGIGFYEALKKKEIKEVHISEEKYHKIFVLLTAPLLFPLIFGMFGLILFLPVYIMFEYINTNPSRTFLITTIISWFLANIFLSVKAYKAMYKTYISKNGAI